jgi:hypothetical protein
MNRLEVVRVLVIFMALLFNFSLVYFIWGYKYFPIPVRGKAVKLRKVHLVELDGTFKLAPSPKKVARALWHKHLRT